MGSNDKDVYNVSGYARVEPCSSFKSSGRRARAPLYQDYRDSSPGPLAYNTSDPSHALSCISTSQDHVKTSGRASKSHVPNNTNEHYACPVIKHVDFDVTNTYESPLLKKVPNDIMNKYPAPGYTEVEKRLSTNSYTSPDPMREQSDVTSKYPSPGLKHVQNNFKSNYDSFGTKRLRDGVNNNYTSTEQESMPYDITVTSASHISNKAQHDIMHRYPYPGPKHEQNDVIHTYNPSPVQKQIPYDNTVNSATTDPSFVPNDMKTKYSSSFPKHVHKQSSLTTHDLQSYVSTGDMSYMRDAKPISHNATPGGNNSNSNNTGDKQVTDWSGVMEELFYNLDNMDSDPILTLENTHDSSSGIASDVTSSHNQSTKMSNFRGDNSSVSSTDRRYSDSSFDRQFSDSSVSVDKSYIKKRQGEGKFPWAYMHGAKSSQQKSNQERVANSVKVSFNNQPTVINDHSTNPYEYQLDTFIHSPVGNQFDLQDIDKLMLTNLKGKSRIRPSPFDLMTDDVIVKIFSNLPTDQLCRCSCVCQRWYRLAWDPLLWKRIVINNENIQIDRALRYLTKRLSYNTPTVCVIVEHINLNGCEQLTDKGLHTIAKSCPELRQLEIQGCANVTNSALFEVVSYCVNLEYLDVTGCPCLTCIRLTDKLLAQATAPHLRQIYLRYLDMSDCTALDDPGLVTISSYCTQLQYLYLRRCVRIGDQGIQSVSINCTSLKELSISDCKRLTDYGGSEISKLGDSLRYLSVAKCDKVSDVAIIQIAKGCKKLRYLNVRSCEAVSDDSLDTIARNLTRLKSLDIGKCDITDEGLVALAYCSQLRKLSVKSCDAITDLGIITIAQHCRRLQQLNIQDCHVTVDAYRTVKKHCKKCLIEHTNPGFY